jgi:hypothetical protein
MIYLIHPLLSLPDSPVADTFCAACDRELRRHAVTSLIDSAGQLHSVEPAPGDAVVFFNHSPEVQYQADIFRILESQAGIFPIAMSKELRIPPTPARNCQSFDVRNELRHRGLDDSNAATVAGVLARGVLASLQPTLSQVKMRLFLSHRRADGEELAGWFYQQLRQRAESGFQDLSDIVVGEEAQSVIESRLGESDAVIFLDTALAFESVWVAKELEVGLALNLPIVWVCAGGDDNGKRLKVRPAERPHLQINADSRDPQIVEQVLDQAFSLARESGMRIFDTARRLKSLSSAGGMELIEKSANKLLYRLQIARKGFRYPEAPMKHVVQFFGRWPKSEDKAQFVQELRSLGENPEVGLLLGPIPAQPQVRNIDGVTAEQPVIIVDSGEEYVSLLEQYVNRASKQDLERLEPLAEVSLARKGDSDRTERGRGLIISGSFPDKFPAGFQSKHQQDLIDAVHAFARAAFDRGGPVIFGAHPVFVPLIFDMARRRRPKDFREAIHLYFSTLYRAVPGDYQNNATVFAIPSVGSDRNASLRKMREAMVHDKQAVGLVAIGGKYARPGLSLGVDEEVELASARGVPAFLIGSVQGRSSQLAADFSAAGWKKKLNTLTSEQNEQLRTSMDYSSLADMVLNSIGI